MPKETVEVVKALMHKLDHIRNMGIVAHKD